MNPTSPNQSPLRGNASNSTGVVNHNKVIGIQRWYKIQTAFLSVFISIISFIAGIPFYMSLTITIFTATLGILWVINKVLPIYPGVLLIYQYINAWFVLIIERLGLDPQASAPSQNTLITATIFLIVPGMLTVFFLWIAVAAVFKRAGAGSTLWTLGTRPPNMNDPKERQVVDIVAKMALAASIQAPDVVLLDNGDANAAFIGTGKQDATIVITRPLLDQCNYEETQGVVAYLVAAISNGDLEITYRLTTIVLTGHLLFILVVAPISTTARRTLFRFLRLPFKRGNRASFAKDADQVIRLLLKLESGKGKVWKWDQLLSWVFFPLLVATIGAIFSLLTYWIFTMFLIAIWPSRCRLTDATAVRLTGNPDGLASALNRFGDRGGYVPGASLAAHLFVTWPRKPKKQMTTNRWYVSAAKDVIATQSLKNEIHMPFMYRPYISIRLKSLTKLGSSITTPITPPTGPIPIWKQILSYTLVCILICIFLLVILTIIPLSLYLLSILVVLLISGAMLGLTISTFSFVISYALLFGGGLSLIQQLINAHIIH